jgi:hypothetical protein
MCNGKEMDAMADGRGETVLEHRERKTERAGYVSSDDIVGKKVKNPEGYDLGVIETLRVGLLEGRVAYVVLKYGGMLGIGAKYFAIPIEAMVYRPGDDVFVVNVSKERLDTDPGFREGEWPREANWGLIESARAMAPPSQEEVRAVTQMHGPPPEVVTTERVEVREGAKYEGKPIHAEVTETEKVAREGMPPPGPATKMGADQPAERAEAAREYVGVADLPGYLEGTTYPAEKRDLIARARENNAPQSVIDALSKFEEKTYRSREDVTSEFGRIR